MIRKTSAPFMTLTKILFDLPNSMLRLMCNFLSFFPTTYCLQNKYKLTRSTWIKWKSWLWKEILFHIKGMVVSSWLWKEILFHMKWTVINRFERALNGWNGNERLIFEESIHRTVWTVGNGKYRFLPFEFVPTRSQSFVFNIFAVGTVFDEMNGTVQGTGRFSLKRTER